MTGGSPSGAESELAQPLTGVVVVRKPQGVTSHTVVAQVRRVLGTRRVGHTGTLDPMATGVLVVCVGQATRIAEYLTGASKEYVAGIVFGVRTNTQDADGAIVDEADAAWLSREHLESVLPRFRGPIQQTPPMVSAVHHDGQRLYALARQGIEVDRPARPVHIYALELIAFEPALHPRATLRVECSTGTYIRTLAADIGEALGPGAMMDSLQRTRVGPFTLGEAHTVEDLAALRADDALGSVVRPVAEALAGWPRIELSDGELERIRQGQPVTLAAAGAASAEPEGEAVVLLTGQHGAAAGIGRVDGRIVRPIKVFQNAG